MAKRSTSKGPLDTLVARAQPERIALLRHATDESGTRTVVSLHKTDQTAEEVKYINKYGYDGVPVFTLELVQGVKVGTIMHARPYLSHHQGIV
jgi:hypothetical protein